MFDEVGNIPSSISVITSLLPEHCANIGPTLEDIAINKLFIGTNSQFLICTEEVNKWNQKVKITPDHRMMIIRNHLTDNNYVPLWLTINNALATKAVLQYLSNLIDKHIDHTTQYTAQLNSEPNSEYSSKSNLETNAQSKNHLIHYPSAAFGTLRINNTLAYFDACISFTSIDTKFIKRLITKQNTIFIASLPDDKDVKNISTYFIDQLKVPYYEIALSGTRGYLHYDESIKHNRVISTVHYEDANKLKTVVNRVHEQYANHSLYFLGTQTFIRLVKIAFLNNQNDINNS